MAVERAQLEVASPSEDDVRAADRLPSTPPPPPPPSLHRLHPSPVLYCESQRQPGRVSVVCVHARCVFVAADQCQLGGGRWYLIPPPTSPPLCICPSQFEQRFFFFFFFCLSCSSLLPTHWFRGRIRGRSTQSAAFLPHWSWSSCCCRY